MSVATVLKPAPAEPDAKPATAAEKALPICRVSGKVDEGGAIGMRLDQSVDALAAMFGDRATLKDGEIAPPYSHHVIQDLLNVSLGGQKLTPGDLPTDRLNAMLQAVGAFEPANELEGMIAVQAVALHHATMDCLQRSMRTDRMEFRVQYLGQANKCSRTFAALLDALNRQRGKTTTQRVIVENVNVQAGGQAVVGAVGDRGER